MGWLTPTLLILLLLLSTLLLLALPTSVADHLSISSAPSSPLSPSLATDDPSSPAAVTDAFTAFVNDVSSAASPSPLFSSDEPLGSRLPPTLSSPHFGRSSTADGLAGVSVSVSNNVQITVDGQRLRTSSLPLSTTSLPSSFPTPDTSEPNLTPDTPLPHLGSSVGVGGASGRRPPPIPLTLVDDHNRPIARGFFKSSEVDERTTMDRRGPPDRLGVGVGAGGGGGGGIGGSAGGGGGGTDVRDQVGTGMIGLDRLSSAPTGGVHLAITDEHGAVISHGTYVPDGADQPPHPTTAAPQPLSSTGAPPTITSSPPISSGSSSFPTWHYTRPPCYDNEYDTSDCERYPHPHHPTRRDDGEPALLPSSDFSTFTPYHAQSVLHSRTAHPRRAVIVPESIVDFAKSDVTMSVTPSLASLPPVPPFIARPQSAASAVAATVRSGLPPSDTPAPQAPLEAAEVPSPEGDPTQFRTLSEFDEEGGGAQEEEERTLEDEEDEEELEDEEAEDAEERNEVGVFLVQQVTVPLWALTELPPLATPLPLSTNPLASPVFRPIVTSITTPIFGIGTAQTTSALLGLAPSGSAGLPSGLSNTIVAALPTAPEFGFGLLGRLGAVGVGAAGGVGGTSTVVGAGQAGATATLADVAALSQGSGLGVRAALIGAQPTGVQTPFGLVGTVRLTPVTNPVEVGGVTAEVGGVGMAVETLRGVMVGRVVGARGVGLGGVRGRGSGGRVGQVGGGGKVAGGAGAGRGRNGAVGASARGSGVQTGAGPVRAGSRPGVSGGTPGRGEGGARGVGGRAGGGGRGRGGHAGGHGGGH